MNELILVILVPFFAAITLALLNGRPRLEKALALAVCLGLSAFVVRLLILVDTHGPVVSMIGGYAAPYGITFVADRLSCIMLCLSMLVGTVVVIYSFWTVTPAQQQFFFYPLFFVLLLGVNWAFVTGDIFNLFVAYEVMLIGSYGMMMVGASRDQVRQTLMYVAINLIGGALFVVGLGLLYALLGTLSMADLAVRSAALTEPRAGMVTAASMILLTVFAIKAAAFPVFFWLPDSYPHVPPGVNAYFAGILTKVGIYSLLRVFVMTFRQPGHELALQVLLMSSGFTMLLGVLGAYCQWEARRILSWHVISQVGYMVMGIGLASDPRIAAAAIAATIFYMVHHIVVKASLFLINGVAERVRGNGELKGSGGVLTLAPGAAGLFLIASLSLAGMPPFSGFLAKLILIQAALRGDHTGIVVVAIVTSFLTLLSMTKIWSYVYLGAPNREQPAASWRGPAAASGILVAATVILGLAAQPFLRLAADAGTEITTGTSYVDAVLGPKLAVVAPVDGGGS